MPPIMIAKSELAIRPPISPSSCEGFVNKRGSDSKSKPSTPPDIAMIVTAIEIPMTYHTTDTKMIFTAVPKAFPQETIPVNPRL